ncbi:hypothetical protein niasHS_010413 [Heterodera schachtii]|uniref:Uncharacterized protein n=1 Tax=Heterodera schachtii TaxID=97005 RepID=A0ABD2IZQ5_HETSC
MKWAANVRERAENLSKFSSIGPLFTPLSGIKQHSASELRGQLPRGTDANAQQRELQRQPAKSFELFETASERKESAEKEQTKQCKEFAAAGLTSGETSEAASDRKENTEKRRKKQSEEFAAAAGLTSGETSEAASNRKVNTEKRRKKQSKEFAAAGLTQPVELNNTASIVPTVVQRFRRTVSETGNGMRDLFRKKRHTYSLMK